ncbi:hypothetical protein RIF23_10920 [Lipingzhangella sp. LS1_29]|uniref:Tetracyclin repressor-like C-terminal domain-containing protein n=1 Tax=Lipingzhangella rawalii TaxID=2055835 RepID=A0ABU2H754_9ACTN|nr:hypothetical protein [Lipingzhangella rawalii]MDS1270812.1 hypothetical protein [Lipingzhangella rawalii]
MAGAAAEAVVIGELAPATDPEQLAFEVEALTRIADAYSLLLEEPAAYETAPAP